MRRKATWISTLLQAVILAICAVPAAAGQFSGTYNFYWKGIFIGDAVSEVEMGAAEYRLGFTFRTGGLLRLFVKGQSDVESLGALDERGRPLARRYRTNGIWGRKTYGRDLKFDASGKEISFDLIWPKDDDDDETEREPVPDDMKVAPDPVSLLIALTSEAAPGQTDVTFRSYDGLSAFLYRLDCADRLEPFRRSGKVDYEGDALHCTMTLKREAGFERPGDKSAGKKNRRQTREEELDETEVPLTIDLWMAPWGEGRYLPIRSDFQTPRGTVKAYLKTIEAGSIG